MITTPEEYLASVGEPGRAWLEEFFSYMRERHPDQMITMFRQCPMYKFGKSYLEGYLMFTVAKEHFSVHTIDFDLIEEMKTRLPRLAFGKGCVKAKYADVDVIPELKKLCDAVIARSRKRP
ncbi:MAG: hypothetical protein JW882_16940 [Deltaproteobacteria bacterium]|nr:hypothetical protein [Deltaproteobacteria bacterium]